MAIPGYQEFMLPLLKFSADGLEHTMQDALPALAEELKAVHNFQEGLREAMGLTSLYNEGLGTVSNKYLYDRVEGRDEAPHHKPWDSAA